MTLLLLLQSCSCCVVVFCHQTLSIHPLSHIYDTPSHHILSTHPLTTSDTPSYHTPPFSHTSNTPSHHGPSHHTLSRHPGGQGEVLRLPCHRHLHCGRRRYPHISTPIHTYPYSMLYNYTYPHLHPTYLVSTPNVIHTYPHLHPPYLISTPPPPMLYNYTTSNNATYQSLHPRYSITSHHINTSQHTSTPNAL